MALTKSQLLADKMTLFRSHGISRDPNTLLRPDEGDWYYEQHTLGFNYRMTDLQAALGLSQLKRLDEFVCKRNLLAAYYSQSLVKLPVVSVDPLPGSVSARHLYMIRLKEAGRRREVFDTMRERGVQVHVHYFPVHLQPYYLSLGFKEGDFPAAEQFYQEILTLPLYPTLDETAQQKVLDELTSSLNTRAAS
ncbi:MAG: hypothetical protein Sw2LagPseu_37450 [Shewanella algae]